MRHVRWIILAAAVAVVVLGILFLPGRLGLSPLRSEGLVTLEPDPGEAYSIPDYGMMLVEFGKTRGAPSIAAIFIYAEPLGPYAHNLHTVLEHDESYRIESMRLTFRIPMNTGGKLALVTPEGGPWNDPVFLRNPADGSISFSVEHLGSLGVGSIGNEFVFQQFAQELGDKPALTLHATFTLRGNGLLQLREDVVDTEIEVVLPGQSTAGDSITGDNATAHAEMALREFLQAWAAKDGAAMEALLTDNRRQYSNYTDPTFFDALDRMEFGGAVAVPEAIDSYMTSGNGGRQGVDRADVRCFRAPVTFYLKPGVVAPNVSGEEYPWLWWLVRGADGRWRVDNWGA